MLEWQILIVSLANIFFLYPVYSHSIDAERDRISALPGFNHSEQIDHFAGFVSIADASVDSQRRDIFYWFIESQSSTRDEDPVVLWTNGGTDYVFLIRSPYRNVRRSRVFWAFGVTLRERAISACRRGWTSSASIIFVEQPLFVGYSLSSEDEDFATNDDINGERLVEFIVGWFKKFDSYQGRDFYLAAESYGGSHTVEILFRGFMVGNPYTNEVESNRGMMDAIWGHGLLPTGQYNNWKRQCGDGMVSEECSWLPWLLWDEYIGDTEVDIYALSYPLCQQGSDHMLQRFRLLDLLFQGKAVNASTHLNLPGLYEPCRESYLTTYLNREDVRSALHVDHARDWAACDDFLFFNYSSTSMQTHMEQHYQTLVEFDYESVGLLPLKILVFSGDDDAVCGTEGTISWLFSMGFNVTAHWESWFFEDALYGKRLGGFYSKLDGIHFATVHGAGHEVPAFKPEASLQLFRDFLALPHTRAGKGRPYVRDEGDGRICSSSSKRMNMGDVWFTALIGVLVGMVLTASGGISYIFWRRDMQSKKNYEAAHDMELPEVSATEEGPSSGVWDTKNPIHQHVTQQGDVVSEEI